MKIQTRSELRGTRDLKKMTVAAMLTALSVAIPLFPIMPKIVIEPFSATLASHLPAILSMFLGPYVCVATSIGSAVGFFLGLGSAVIAMRALSHIIFTLTGWFMLSKKVNVWVVYAVTMILHGIAEALVATIYGSSLSAVWLTVGVFTMIHHTIDFTITMVILKALRVAKVM